MAIACVEETYDVDFDESNGSQGAHVDVVDIGNKSLEEAMKNMAIGDIRPKEEDKDEVQMQDQPSSSMAPQVGSEQSSDKEDVLPNEDTHVTLDQALQDTQDVDAPTHTPQVTRVIRSHLTQAHPQNLMASSLATGANVSLKSRPST